MLKTYFSVALFAIIIENVVLVRFLGVCPLLGVTDNKQKTIAMSVAVISTMVFSSAFCWIINKYVLIRFGLEYLQTLMFIFVTAFIVQFVEMMLRRFYPEIAKSLGIYVPLITTNCAILGCVILGIESGYGFALTVFYGAMSGVSFMLAMVLFSLIRQRIELSDTIPESFKGTPVLLIAASLLAMIFSGFSGVSF